MQLCGKLVQREKLTGRQRDQMFELMVAYYANMDRITFEADLNEKQWVILVTDPYSDQIQGFSTQTLLDVSVQGKPIRALFSGDTIVRREYWARNPLAQVWGRLALSLIERKSTVPLYWFLITKGYKTYRFLPVFFHDFFPRYDLATPPWAREVIGALGQSKFPASYDHELGMVRTHGAGCHLRRQIAEIDGDRLRNPHIRFFAQRNPGHARGDELCCIAPLTRDNLTPAAYRVIGTHKLMSIKS